MTALSAPTLVVTGRSREVFERKLPPSAKVCVETGMIVRARDVVALASVSGKMVSVAAAEMLGVTRSKVQSYLTVAPGDGVTKGQMLGQRDALFGLLKSRIVSPVDGTIESVSGISGHLMIREISVPVTVEAYVNGEVVEINEKNGVRILANVSKVQGAFGVGGEVTGVMVDANADTVAGKIVCAFEPVTNDALASWREAGAIGVVTPSIDGDELYRFCGDALNLAATGDEDIGMTLVVTEGFGRVPMAKHTMCVLSGCIGQEVSMCGITQVRAGVIRPEIIGPVLADAENPADAPTNRHSVKIVRGRYFGNEGIIVAAPASPQKLASGVEALVYRVKLMGGEEVVDVPRANVV
ncbi:MAG: hypothetical protein JXX14_26150 [Deltaproteobacteria bacterium]|nr:hypothetical protein [Deltaproteobacteria bacterium]